MSVTSRNPATGSITPGQVEVGEVDGGADATGEANEDEVGETVGAGTKPGAGDVVIQPHERHASTKIRFERIGP